MKVYVLAAGHATRLYPLTRATPKPLLDVAGVPILTRILERVAVLDSVSEVVVIGNERFAGQFDAWAGGVRSPFPLRVLNDGSRSEDDRLGAVGDLGFALREVPPGAEDWLVVAGDNLLEFDLCALQAEFEKQGRPLLVLRETEPRGPSRYNEVTLGDAGLVTRFREKPAAARALPRRGRRSRRARPLRRVARRADGGRRGAPRRRGVRHRHARDARTGAPAFQLSTSSSRFR